MNSRSLVLVTGATGAVGPRVVIAFQNAGFSIRTLSIDKPPTGIWGSDVEVIIGDITDASVVMSAMKGVDVVIHLAAILHIANPPPTLQEKYERINVGGTSNIVEAAIQAGVKRILYFSTIAVYGRSNGQVLTEDSLPNPDTLYAKTKLTAEKIVLEANNANGQPIGTILRLGAVYGSRIKGNYRRLLQSLARGLFISIGNGSNRRTLIYDKDVARAALLACEHQDAGGKIFNISDGKEHTLNEIISAMCIALGRNKPCFSLPLGPVRFTAGMIEDISRWMGCRPPIMRASVDKYTEDVSVDSRRSQQELGFVPMYDLVSGWKNTVDELRQSGEL